MNPEQSKLGKKTSYINKYEPSLLFPIDRETKRTELDIDTNNLPFFGHDIWTHYEVSWLNKKGKPQVAIAIIVIPCHSSCLLESKSLKLYFNSLNSMHFSDWSTVEQTIIQDLSLIVKTDVQLHLYSLANTPFTSCTQLEGVNLDEQDVYCNQYQPNKDLLRVHPVKTTEVLHSNLLKSNCLVTNQPDWGSVQIAYRGNQIDHESLLQYIVSFREHNEFHEQCIERMFVDIMCRCHPEKLTITSRYTRRGGLDINPIRSSHPIKSLDLSLRLIRQ